MKKSIMRKWVAALRSGEYMQGKGRLVSDKDEFCCLGVLCNLAVDAGIGEWKKDEKAGAWNFATSTDNNLGFLPHEVQKWAGMDSSNGARKDGVYATPLTVLNDNGKSFTEIADIIEANWEAL